MRNAGNALDASHGFVVRWEANTRGKQQGSKTDHTKRCKQSNMRDVAQHGPNAEERHQQEQASEPNDQP